MLDDFPRKNYLLHEGMALNTACRICVVRRTQKNSSGSQIADCIARLFKVGTLSISSSLPGPLREHVRAYIRSLVIKVILIA